MNSNKYIFSLLVTVAGILMIVSPEVFFKMGVIILGIAAAIDGLFVLVTTRHLIIDPHYRLMMTIRGILSIVVGTVAVILPIVTAAIIWKIMAYVLGGYLLVSAGLEVYGILKLHRNGIMIKQSLIETIVLVILAIALFIIPSKTAGGIIVGICGALLIFAGVFSAFLQWRNRPITVVPDSVVTENPDDSEKTDSDENSENI